MRSLEQKVSRPAIMTIGLALLIFGIVFARNVYSIAFDISLEANEVLAGTIQ